MARLDTCSLTEALFLQLKNSGYYNENTGVVDSRPAYRAPAPVMHIPVTTIVESKSSPVTVQLTINIDNNTSVETLKHIKEILQIL